MEVLVIHMTAQMPARPVKHEAAGVSEVEGTSSTHKDLGAPELRLRVEVLQHIFESMLHLHRAVRSKERISSSIENDSSEHVSKHVNITWQYACRTQFSKQQLVPA